MKIWPKKTWRAWLGIAVNTSLWLCGRLSSDEVDSVAIFKTCMHTVQPIGAEEFGKGPYRTTPVFDHLSERAPYRSIAVAREEFPTSLATAL